MIGTRPAVTSAMAAITAFRSDEFIEVKSPPEPAAIKTELPSLAPR